MNEMDFLAEYASEKSETAFAAVVERYAGPVYSACLRRLRGDAEQAEEAAQAVFILLATQPEKVGKTGNLAGWLHRMCGFTVQHLKREAVRRKKREIESAKRRSEMKQKDLAWENIQYELDECLDKLPARQRDVLLLFYLQGYKQAEIATMLDCGERTVRDRLKKGLENLRQFLASRGTVTSAAVLGTILLEKTLEAAPALLVSKSITAGVAAVSGATAASATTSTALIAKGVMKMLFWTKVKTVAVSSAIIVSISSLIPVAVNLATASDKPEPEKTVEITTEKKEQGTLVNGILFEPVVPDRFWVAWYNQGADESIPTINFRVTNKLSKQICLNRCLLTLHLATTDGRSFKRMTDFRGNEKQHKEDFLFLKSGESALLKPAWTSKALGASLGASKTCRFRWRDGLGNRWYHDLALGKHKLILEYYSETEEGSYWDNDKETNISVPIWKGRAKSKPVMVRIAKGMRGSIRHIAANHLKAERNLGRLGCLAIRSESRLQMIRRTLGDLGLAFNETLSPNFQNEMIVCLVRAGDFGSELNFTELSPGKKISSMQFRCDFYPIGKNNPEWEFIAVAVPKSEQIEVSGLMVPPGFDPASTSWRPADATHYRWTIGPKGGDVVDGLQGYIEAQRKTIKPGEDIRLNFILKAVDEKQKEPIYVWDNFYAGYRNDAFIVKSPDGKIHLLRRKVQKGWDKWAPRAVDIRPGKPFMLGQDGVAFPKRLKKWLGLDTDQPGIYTIYGLYMEEGGKGQGGTADRFRKTDFWGGNIATNTIEVEVK